MGSVNFVRYRVLVVVCFLACEVPNPAYQEDWELDGSLADAPTGVVDAPTVPNTGGGSGTPMFVVDAAIVADASIPDAGAPDAEIFDAPIASDASNASDASDASEVQDAAPDPQDTLVAVMDAQTPMDVGGTDPLPELVFPPGLALGLVSYWPLDETTGRIAFDRISANHGSVDNPNPEDFWITGYRNGGATFHRDNNWAIEVPASQSINRITRQVSVAAWVRPEPFDDVISVISRQLGDSWHDQFDLGFQNQRAQFFMYDARFDWALQASGFSILPTDVWMHLAGTYDGTTLRIYVNGNLEGQMNGIATLSADTKPVFIGDNANQGTYGRRETWNGDLDEVVLYERALSGSEIRELMTLQKPRN